MPERARSLVAGVAVVVVSSLALAGCGNGSTELESTSRSGLGLIAFEKDDGIYVARGQTPFGV
jgi:hypothetical protein